MVDPRLRDADVDDELFHYVRKDKITESAVLGNVVTALCGAVFPVTKTPKPGSPVCPTCRELMEMLKAFGPGGSGGEGGPDGPGGGDAPPPG
ncbi:MAG TPA: DUF3039 domain-containing protein [Mycobacteriales bacterium]|nr:DUF3039 domain-containing protein [Mycobacteriales bacterium]